MTARDRYFQCLLRVLLYRNRDGYTFRIEVNAVYLDQLYGSRNVFIRHIARYTPQTTAKQL